MFLVACAVGLASLVACGTPAASPRANYGTAVPETIYNEADRPGIPEVLNPVDPSLKAFLPVDVDNVVAQRVREVPGVGAVARFGLSKLNVTASAGIFELTIASVEPIEFRPLAPLVSAKAGFVWRRLIAGEMVMAHEEHRQLGVKAGDSPQISAPSGERRIKVGAIAANGVPDLAGALVSVDTARSLGLPEPRSLLIGIADGADSIKVRKSLESLLGVKPERIFPPAGKAFTTGKDTDRLIGTFSYMANPDGTITQDPAWVKKYIVTRKVPLLGSVTGHRVLIPQLSAALAEVERAGLGAHIDRSQYGGGYYPRFIARDPSRPISLHAWGLAVDINTVDNPQGAQPKMDMRVVEIFERWGFRWGGRWSPPDGHHFELAAIVTG